MHRQLDELVHLQRRRIIGLMSGTSADGIDAALIEVHGSGEETEWELAAFVTVPFEPGTRREILALQAPGAERGLERAARLHFRLAEEYAAACRRVAGQAGIDLRDVHLAGLHGQTLFHGTDRRDPALTPATLQVGEAQLLAERTGLSVVHNFRARDVAAGGTGAPLVPYVDWLLFRSDETARLCLNIGGIANFTALPRGATLDQVTAFDTGPGNMVIDALAAHYSDGREPFDRDGARAGQGRPDESFLIDLMAHEYFDRTPPKSAGREEFGTAAVAAVLRYAAAHQLSPARVMATVTRWTARSIALSYRLHVLSRAPIDEVIVSGGGVHNRTLMAALAAEFGSIPVRSSASLGLDPDAREAVAFAILANESIHGRPGNLPSVTGAARGVVLGSFTPGRLP